MVNTSRALTGGLSETFAAEAHGPPVVAGPLIGQSSKLRDLHTSFAKQRGQCMYAPRRNLTRLWQAPAVQSTMGGENYLTQLASGFTC